jgi:predicted DNA-binding transcriptional regulator YafY
VVAQAAVRALRSGERGGGRQDAVVGPAASRELPRTAVNETLQALRDAVQQQHSVWLGYIGTDGVAAERVVDPVEVRGGWLTAFDQRAEQVRTFAVHRITGVAVLDDVLDKDSDPDSR